MELVYLIQKIHRDGQKNLKKKYLHRKIKIHFLRIIN